jgi:hypothetical protein
VSAAKDKAGEKAKTAVEEVKKDGKVVDKAVEEAKKDGKVADKAVEEVKKDGKAAVDDATKKIKKKGGIEGC